MCDDFCKTNRYKLKKEIKRTGYTAEALSKALGNCDGYFHNYTSAARLKTRGDITELRYIELVGKVWVAHNKLKEAEKKESKPHTPSETEKKAFDDLLSGFDKKLQISKENQGEFESVVEKLQGENSKSKTTLTTLLLVLILLILSVYYFVF